MKNIIIIFGGESCEHDVSVITGVMALNAIDRAKYLPIPIYVAKNGKWYTGKNFNDISIFKNIRLSGLTEVAVLPPSKILYSVKKNKLKEIGEIYSVVNCCHGGDGEGGALYAIFKTCNLPCTSSNLFASSVAIDKELTKLALKSISVNCLPCVKIIRDNFYLNRDSALDMVKVKLGFPVIVKPATLGSSIGITIAKDEKQLEKGLSLAFAYDGKAIVEKALDGFREINCAAYKRGGEVVVSECEEPLVKGEILTFNDKYNLPTPKDFPAKLDKDVQEKIKHVTKTVYKRLHFSGVVRIDYLLQDKEVFLNEINAIPGSLAYYLFCKTTDEFSKFLSNLIEESVDEARVYWQNKTTFDGGVLNLSSCKTKR